MGFPLVKYLAITSACLPNESTSMNATSSRSSPFCILNLRLQATVNLQMAMPPGVTRISGSRVRLPIKMTLLKEAI